jgi:hypothetical protein
VRSIVTIAVGFLFIAVLTLGTDALVRVAFPDAFDESGRTEKLSILIFSVVDVGIYTIVGCYLTARLAPSRPMWHALVVGLLGLIFVVADTIAFWPEAPTWFNVLSLAPLMLYAWIGGKLAARARTTGGTPSAARGS